jgi:cell division transport system permease protein
MSKTPFGGERLAQDISEFAGKKAASLIPNTRISGPIPWVIAIMIALTIMAAAGAMAINNLAAKASADLSGAVTVQVVEADLDERRKNAARAAEILGSDSAVASVRQVPQDELNALLEPWLGSSVGSGDVGEAVPIPALIDVELAEAASAEEIARLQAKLDAQVPGIRVDAQSSWLQPVYSALTSLQYLALVLIMLLAITSAAAVWLAARSAFSTHHETIEIVHHLGGTDEQIARIFQRTVAKDAAMGGGIGLLMGVTGVLLVGQQFSALDSGMIDGGGLSWPGWLVIVLIPLLGIGLAVLTARSTVMRALRRML